MRFYVLHILFAMYQYSFSLYTDKENLNLKVRFDNLLGSNGVPMAIFEACYGK